MANRLIDQIKYIERQTSSPKNLVVIGSWSHSFPDIEILVQESHLDQLLIILKKRFLGVNQFMFLVR
jgi:hypothetical protein